MEVVKEIMSKLLVGVVLEFCRKLRDVDRGGSRLGEKWQEN